MKHIVPIALVASALGIAGTFAQVQPITPPSDTGYYGGGYPVYTHSSTPAEGRLRGMGDLVRSAGSANLDNSAAAVNYSVARQNEIENRDRWTSTYFSMRQTNREARAAERGRQPTMEDAVRFAQAGRPRRLSPGEFDSVTGQVTWPLLLQTDAYASSRAQLEKILGERAEQGAISPNDYTTARQLVDAMLGQVKKQIKDVPPEQALRAQEFLRSLNFEIVQPVG